MYKKILAGMQEDKHVRLSFYRNNNEHKTIDLEKEGPMKHKETIK